MFGRLSTSLVVFGCLLSQGWVTHAQEDATAIGATNDTSSGTNDTMIDDDLAPVTSLKTGSFHTVVIIRDSGVNVVKNWGANGQGQLGLNDTKDRGDNDGDVGNLLPEVQLGTGLQAVDITAGLRHSVALMNDGTIRSWGYNGKGQLGIGSIQNIGDQPREMGDNMAATPLGDVSPVEVVAGGWHTCSIVDGNRLKCWGYNQWGELGLEDQNDRGDEPGEMGDNLPFVDVDGDVQAVALGDWHTCALVDDGEIKCFGKNYAGQLGLGNAQNQGDENGEMGSSLDSVDLGGRKATAIACGEEHTCALLEGGDVVCWGLGSSGQLGQGSAMNIGDSANDMSNLAPIDLGTGRTAVEVTAGGNHTCALLDNDDVKCWGENNYGELGQGDTFTRGIAPEQMGDNLRAIELPTGWKLHTLQSGYYHTCALVSQITTVDGIVCWGANFNGQMGLGISETENIGDDPGEMGENLRMANLGGDYVVESGNNKWYEQEWFYITCGVIGAVLLCCLCLLIRQAHGDTSGRGSVSYVAAKPKARAKEATINSPVVHATPGGSAGSAAASNPNSGGGKVSGVDQA